MRKTEFEGGMIQPGPERSGPTVREDVFVSVAGISGPSRKLVDADPRGALVATAVGFNRLYSRLRIPDEMTSIRAELERLDRRFTSPKPQAREKAADRAAELLQTVYAASKGRRR